MQNALAETEAQAEGFEKERDFYFESTSASLVSSIEFEADII
jgi:hypothetical protein